MPFLAAVIACRFPQPRASCGPFACSGRPIYRHSDWKSRSSLRDVSLKYGGAIALRAVTAGPAPILGDLPALALPLADDEPSLSSCSISLNSANRRCDRTAICTRS